MQWKLVGNFNGGTGGVGGKAGCAQGAGAAGSGGMGGAGGAKSGRTNYIFNASTVLEVVFFMSCRKSYKISFNVR